MLLVIPMIYVSVLAHRYLQFCAIKFALLAAATLVRCASAALTTAFNGGATNNRGTGLGYRVR
jgi:hypothetical protein